jgi:hypothetical protein
MAARPGAPVSTLVATTAVAEHATPTIGALPPPPHAPGLTVSVKPPA